MRTEVTKWVRRKQLVSIGQPEGARRWPRGTEGAKKYSRRWMGEKKRQKYKT